MMDYKKAQDRRGAAADHLKRSGYAMGGIPMRAPMGPPQTIMPSPAMNPRPMIKDGGKPKK